MALLDWLNGDKFGVLRDKVNAYKALLQGGALGKILTGGGVGNDPTWQDLGTAVLPDQTGNANKYLKTNGTVASWADLPTLAVDRQNINGDPNANYPITGQQSIGTVIGSLEVPEGPTRKYLLIASMTFNRITTSPETIWCFFKNNVSIAEFKSVAIPVDGQTQTVTISHMDEASPEDVYEIRVKSNGGNQIKQRFFSFSIDGYPV